MVISSFAGVRAVETRNDFIIECLNNFINLVGIQSPGLTASPMLGEIGANFVLNELKPVSNKNFKLAPLSIKFSQGDK